MKKGKVKIYQLNNDGQYILDNETNDYDDLATIERINAMTLDKKCETEGLPKDVYDTLLTNPFLFIKTSENEKHIISLEDFIVKYKDINESLGSILRSKKYTKRKKKQIFKKQFKLWSIDATKTTKQIFKDAGDSISVAKDQKFISINFGHKVGLFLGIIIPLFLLSNIVSWLTITNKIIKYIALGIMALGLIGLFVAVFQDIRISKFKSYVDKQTQIYKKYLREINKNLKKKSKKVEKYYCKALSKKTLRKAPVPIDKITIGGDKLKYLKDETEVITKKCMAVLKNNKRFNGCYVIPLIFSFLAWIPSVGYLIYLLVLKLIDYFK